MEKGLSKKVGNSLKWAAITEIIAKIIIPINNMILARLLTPEAFGIVATVNMVVSFVEVFLFGVKQGFWVLVYSRAFVTIPFMILNLIAIRIFMDISSLKMLKNLLKPVLCTIVMSVVALCLQQVSDNILWSFVSILICIVVYGVAFFVVSRKDAVIVFDICKKYINKFLTK